MVQQRGIDVDTAGSLPDRGAQQGVACLDIETQVTARLAQDVVEATVRGMVRFELPAEMGRINAGFSCPVVVEGHLEKLEVLCPHIRDVLVGSEDPADSAAVPVEAFDEQFFQGAGL